MAEEIRVSVIFSRPEATDQIPLVLPAGSTLHAALKASGLMQKHGLDEDSIKVGVFSKLARLDTSLRDLDRVEIYRPLIADPKAVRKARAAEGKSMKKGTSRSKSRP